MCHHRSKRSKGKITIVEPINALTQASIFDFLFNTVAVNKAKENQCRRLTTKQRRRKQPNNSPLFQVETSIMHINRKVCQFAEVFLLFCDF